jgi:hypothetical protein
MKLVFNLAFDGEPWPGPLGYSKSARETAVGEAWVGPLGLLAFLETQLGLPDPTVSAGERDAALVPAVLESRGFWSRSAEVDPLGVARTLRRWRDELVLHGWDPAGTQERGKDTRKRRKNRRKSTSDEDRLAGLRAVTATLSPGLPDRIRAVIDELEPNRLELEELTLLAQPREGLPLLWRRLVDRLADLGVAVTEAQPSPPKRRRSDLARALEPGFKPRGDGSLQLVRPVGPQATAEAVAAWLARVADQDERDALDGTVIIGGDALLDAALRQRGLPTCGAPSASDGDPLLAILPLVLLLGWGPTDPQVALDLLALPTGPVPRRLAWTLSGTLSSWPSVDNPDWKAELERWLAGQDADYGARVTARLSRLFQVDAPGDAYPASALAERAKLIEDWARGRRGLAERRSLTERGADPAGGGPERWDAVIADCVSLRRVAAATGAPTLTATDIEDLVETADVGQGAGSRFEAQVGLHHVTTPDQLAGPARRVVWWGFTRESASRPYRPPFSADELDRLAAEGVELPEPGQAAIRAREGWLRPFQLAKEALILLCPQLDEELEAESPHPIWDEVVAPLDRPAVARLTYATPENITPERSLRLLPLPEPAEQWSTGDPDLLGPLPRLSPSSLDKLVGCPLCFTLEREARITANTPAELGGGSSLFGSIAHRVYELLLARYIGKRLPSPKRAEQAAAELFDDLLPELDTTLCLPGKETERATFRRRVLVGARELVTRLRQAGGRVKAVEQDVSRKTARRDFSGKADLELDDPPALVDYKWTRSKYLSADLTAGVAHQLAIYAWCVGSGRALPPAAYLSVQDAELLTTTAERFPGATLVEGPDLRVTLQAVDRALDEVRSDRAEGLVRCAGTPDDEEDRVTEAEIDDQGRLRLEPPCRYCYLGDLCQQEVSR